VSASSQQQRIAYCPSEFLKDKSDGQNQQQEPNGPKTHFGQSLKQKSDFADYPPIH
jgi:hypothetical protein